MAVELQIQLEKVHEPQHSLQDILRPSSLCRVALPINEAIMDLAKDGLAHPSSLHVHPKEG